MYLKTLSLYQIVSLLRSNSQNIIRVNLLGNTLQSNLLCYIYLYTQPIYKSTVVFPTRLRNTITTTVTVDSTTTYHLKQHLRLRQALRPYGTILVQRTIAANRNQLLWINLRKLLKGQILIIQGLRPKLKILEL